MMRYPATPGEFDRLVDSLEGVPRERHPAIARMVFLQIAPCRRCDRPVRRCDPRWLVGGHLLHLSCCAVDAGSAGGRVGGQGGDRRG